MGFGAPIHWIVVLLVVFLLFGSGRISSLMGDVAKGIKNFKKGMSEDEGGPRPADKIEGRVSDATADRDREPLKRDA